MTSHSLGSLHGSKDDAHLKLLKSNIDVCNHRLGDNHSDFLLQGLRKQRGHLVSNVTNHVYNPNLRLKNKSRGSVLSLNGCAEPNCLAILVLKADGSHKELGSHRHPPPSGAQPGATGYHKCFVQNCTFCNVIIDSDACQMACKDTLASCISGSLIYQLECVKCTAIYVGLTSMPWRRRLYNHVSSFLVGDNERSAFHEHNKICPEFANLGFQATILELVREDEGGLDEGGDDAEEAEEDHHKAAGMSKLRERELAWVRKREAEGFGLINRDLVEQDEFEEVMFGLTDYEREVIEREMAKREDAIRRLSK